MESVQREGDHVPGVARRVGADAEERGRTLAGDVLASDLLSNVAEEWQSVDTLRALTTVRDDAMARMHWNAEGTMFAGRVLGPLRWFGLLEYWGPPDTAEVGWRKTALFDRFLSFDVHVAEDRGTGH